MRLFCFVQANTFCRHGCIYFLAALVLVYVDVISCIFRHITEEETITIIDEMENKSSPGYDGISNKMLKYIQKEISKPLTLIINQMLDSGIFPNFKNPSDL